MSFGGIGWAGVHEAPEMPEAYTQNRMAEMGMPGIAQIGEALFDSIRRNKFNKTHGITMDEFRTPPQAQVDSTTSEPVGRGNPVGDIGTWTAGDTIFKSLLSTMMGGMGGGAGR